MALSNKLDLDETFVRIYDVWGRKTPSYEKHYETEVIKPLTDFGYGTNEASDAKGKILGAGYEVLIMAFFIGLYSNEMKPLDEDENIKDLGQPIQYWGNLDSKKHRKAYPRLREYIFIALVARNNDIDWLELDKGKWTINETVSLLMDTMEQYINYGLNEMKKRLDDDESFFLSKNSFIDMFKELTTPAKEEDDFNDVPEALE